MAPAPRSGCRSQAIGSSRGLLCLWTVQTRHVTIRSAQHKLKERAQQTTVQHYGFDNSDRNRLRRDRGPAGGHVSMRQRTAAVREATRSRNFEQGWKAFRDAPEPDAPLYDAVLGMCAKLLRYEQGLEVFNEMREDWKSVVTFSTMIDMAARCKRPALAEKMMEDMQAAGVQPNVITFTALIKVYGATSQPHKALEAFDALRPLLRDANTQTRQMAYQVILAAVSREGDYATASRLFSEMRDNNVPADRGHYHSLLAACSRVGDEETAEQIFAALQGSGLTPDIQTYSIMTSCLRNNLPRCKELHTEMRQRGINQNATYFVEFLEAFVLAGDAAGARALFAERPRGVDLRSRKCAALLRHLHQMP